MRKSQADIITAVIIVVIALGLATTAYFWGLPLIQKRQDTALVERAHNYFDQGNVNSLPNVIETIATIGGERTLFVDVDGIWILNESENYIQFTFMSKAAKFVTDTIYPISLTKGVQCLPKPSPLNGTVGLDRASVVCVQVNKFADEYNITYKVWFRELYESPYEVTRKGYKINLKKDPAGLERSTGKEVRVSFSDTKSIVVGNKTLIIKEIKITLI